MAFATHPWERHLSVCNTTINVQQPHESATEAETCPMCAERNVITFVWEPPCTEDMLRPQARRGDHKTFTEIMSEMEQVNFFWEPPCTEDMLRPQADDPHPMDRS